jgi:hypothetical protein
MRNLALDRDGAFLISPALSAAGLAALEAQLEPSDVSRPGVRLFGKPGINGLLANDGLIGRWIAALSEAPLRPVRAVLFDKSDDNNWSLAWHQDRVIAVKAQIDVPGYGPWSRKHGELHVAPPFSILEAMLTIRVHIDPVDADNAPLLVALGSHQLGRISASDCARVAASLETIPCLADAGDIWVYRTPIVHASDAARRPRRRRVLQVDYASGPLPGGLEWLGV